MAAQHQHYVPQLLLRGFLSRSPELAAKEQVHVLDLEEGKEFTPSIANIMGERRYNDFWLDDETFASIEDSTSRIESHVTPLVEQIRRDRQLRRTGDEIGDLALLMAFQFIRTKRMRLLPERMDEQIKAEVQKMGFDPAKVKGLEEWDEEKLKRFHVEHQIKNLASYTQIFAKKEFFLMTAPEGCSFYLGDNPVVLHNDEERRGMMGNLGIGAPYIQTYLPLSAEVTLCAYDSAVLGQLMIGRDEEMAKGQGMALRALMDGKITAAQMREIGEAAKEFDLTTPIIDSIRSGNPVKVGREQVECYNSLQVSQAHRFVVDPVGKFVVANDVMAERKAKVAKPACGDRAGDEAKRS